VRLVIVDETLRLFVPGVPVSQGSKVPFVVAGRAKLRDSNDAKLRPWRKTVKLAAAAAMEGRPALRDEPLVVSIEFRFVPGKTVRREMPHVKPDIDKLIRSIFDSLTDAGVWGDDSQVVKTVAEKVYAASPGVLVRVGRYINTKGTTR
jgi:Holliday junction resolvase RusA-like endonuclease